MACSCDEGSGDFIDEWMNGLEVTLSDSEGTEGTLRLSWAALLGLLFLVLIIVTWAKDS